MKHSLLFKYVSYVSQKFHTGFLKLVKHFLLFKIVTFMLNFVKKKTNSLTIKARCRVDAYPACACACNEEFSVLQYMLYELCTWHYTFWSSFLFIVGSQTLRLHNIYFSSTEEMLVVSWFVHPTHAGFTHENSKFPQNICHTNSQFV